MTEDEVGEQLPNLLGLQSNLDVAEATRLADSLVSIWTATIAAPGDLDVDLERLRQWFDPVAQGQRLRRELAVLKPRPPRVSDPGPPWTLTVDEDSCLVTPEGRCVMDLVSGLPRDREVLSLRDRQLLPYERRLGILYRGWSRHRLQSVVDLLAGRTKPLQIPAAGVVVALLVNRCTSEARALTRFAGGPEKESIDRGFFASVKAFSDVLAPSSRRHGEARQLVSGWMLYEARRRVGDGLVVEDVRGGHNGRVWIDERAIDEVEDRVARDLVRGHRARATPEKFAEAFDALVAALRREFSNFAGYGLVHEQPRNTARLRERLLNRLATYRAEV